MDRAAAWGALAVFGFTVLATLLDAYLAYGELSWRGVWRVQIANPALWTLDGMTVLAWGWGRYLSASVATLAEALLQGQVKTFRQQTARTNNYDPVTELPNDGQFCLRLEQALNHAMLTHRQLAVLLLEFENFKDIQNSLGRKSADSLLKQASARLQGCIAHPESLARLDGNVFALLLDQPGVAEQAITSAKALLQALELPCELDGAKLALCPVVGIVLYPSHADDTESLLQRAHVALRLAANTNQGYAVYDPAMDLDSPQRLTLLGELRHAITTNQMDLFYQAKVSTHNGQLVGAEALVRWQHPKHGAFAPDEFIPLAERNRMVKPLTIWILQRAFDDCKHWRAQGLDFTLSVNLSAKELLDPELPDLVAGVLASTQIRPQWIMFEVTENAVVSHEPKAAQQALRRLHDMGFQLAIDDYGVGHASMQTLKSLPLAEMKIDRSLVGQLVDDDNAALAVKAGIDMGHQLGLRVTAEGVESAEALARLTEYGCEMAQGFYFNRPMPAEDFDRWLAACGGGTSARSGQERVEA